VTGSSLTPLAIVHAADVIVQEKTDGNDISHAAIDSAYRENLGLTDRLPIWREQWAGTVETLQHG